VSDSIPRIGVDAVVVVGIHLFMDAPFLANTKMVGIQSEQLPLSAASSGRLGRNLARFKCVEGYYDLVFDWIPRDSLGGTVFLPYGCVQSRFESFRKDFDVCFIGNIHGNRREAILDSLKNEFSFFPTFSPGFGFAKIDAVRRSRILLNLKFYPDGGFEGPRVFDYLANGAFVLSEFSRCTLPFVDGRDFVQFLGEEELQEKLRWFLKEEATRERIARQGHDTSQRFTYDRIAQILLDCLCGVELHSSSRRRMDWIVSRVKAYLFQSRDTAASALQTLRDKY